MMQGMVIEEMQHVKKLLNFISTDEEMFKEEDLEPEDIKYNSNRDN